MRDLAFSVPPPDQLLAHALPASADHVAQGLRDDGARHLALAYAPVDEHNRDLRDAQAVEITLIGRLDQEAITDQVDGVEIDRFERFAPVTFVPGRTVAHG